MNNQTDSLGNKLEKFDNVHCKSPNVSGIIYKFDGNDLILRVPKGLKRVKRENCIKIEQF